MSSTTSEPTDVRAHVQLLLATIGVSRIIVVDDEYAPEVEELIGICAVLNKAQAATLPHFHDLNFGTDREIWRDGIRERWERLDATQRREALAQAHAFEPEVSRPGVRGELQDVEEGVDTRAARSLGDILGGLEECQYVALALHEWRQQADELLADDQAANTVLLFDRDFSREENGTDDEGPKLIHEVQRRNVGYCGLITHTVSPGAEYDAWSKLADEFNLVRDKFVVISKERLTSEMPDYYAFLGMLRLVVLSARYAKVKSAAWGVFEKSVAGARAAVENLSVLDFDRIVFGSSRQEGVWEADTLFRVFGILMRREAREFLHCDTEISTAVAVARRVSAMPDEIAIALDTENASDEALRLQRFENYELDDDLNRFHVPIALGDIFETISNGKQYILLVQPCDLMVRRCGKRGYEDDKHGRTGALVELVVVPGMKKRKESWGEMPFFREDTGKSAFADFAKVHQVQLAVLDLCALRTDGVATMDVEAPCPALLLEPWRERYKRLRKFFNTVLTRYEDLEKRQVSDDLKSLALPASSSTVRLLATVDGKIVRYQLKRVMRLRQPRSGALLTECTQYQARAAFEHPFDHRVPTQMAANGNHDSDHDEEPAEKE